MEPNEIVWEGKVGDISLRVGVHHAERILAEWDTPHGRRHKVAGSIEEFERAVLFQILLGAGETDAAATEEVVAAVKTAAAERPRPQQAPAPRRRKGPKARRHRKSRRPPLRP
jgi:hypothetical protein